MPLFIFLYMAKYESLERDYDHFIAFLLSLLSKVFYIWLFFFLGQYLLHCHIISCVWTIFINENCDELSALKLTIWEKYWYSQASDFCVFDLHWMSRYYLKEVTKKIRHGSFVNSWQILTKSCVWLKGILTN